MLAIKAMDLLKFKLLVAKVVVVYPKYMYVSRRHLIRTYTKRLTWNLNMENGNNELLIHRLMPFHNK